MGKCRLERDEQEREWVHPEAEIQRATVDMPGDLRFSLPLHCWYPIPQHKLLLKAPLFSKPVQQATWIGEVGRGSVYQTQAQMSLQQVELAAQLGS